MIYEFKFLRTLNPASPAAALAKVETQNLAPIYRGELTSGK
jgi:hypothetical protein